MKKQFYTIMSFISNLDIRESWLYIALLIIGIYLIYKQDSEGFSDLSEKKSFERKSKDIRTFVPCNKCKQFENHVDTRSKCDEACKYSLSNSNAQGIGAIKGVQGVQCECGYKAVEGREFVNCPKPSSLKNITTTNDCFIWNKNEAERICPVMCKKYLPKHYDEITWTGKFDNTTTHTSACECKYYG